MKEGKPDFDAVFDSQKAFRTLLRAMARPGEIERLPHTQLCPPQGLSPYPMLVLFSLLDHEVSFEVIDEKHIIANLAEVTNYIAVRTRSSVIPFRNADFILVYGGTSKGRIVEAQRGTLEYPDRGATVLYEVNAIGEILSDGIELQLTGPGIKDRRCLCIDGLARDEVESILKTRQEFPLGVDIILSDSQGKVAALPRSTEINYGGHYGICNG